MASMTETLVEQLGQRALVGAVADRLGIDEATAASAVRIGLPVIVAGLARNSAKKKGATDLHDALDRDHDGSLLDNLADYVGRAGAASAPADRSADGDGILEHILGKKRARVETEVGRRTGVDPSILSRLLPLLAPLVMAYLGRKQRQDGLGPGDLAGYLEEEETTIDRRGGLTGMLDRDGDGRLTGEATQIGMSVLRKILASRAAKA